MPEAIFVQGMSGLGDNLHQRAFVKRWVAQGSEVWIATPWPAVYSDLPGVHCMRRPEMLRTQAKNAERQAHQFSAVRPPANARVVNFSYNVHTVRAAGGSVLGAMAITIGESPEGLDFSLPVPAAWVREAIGAVGGSPGPDKPVLIYRPLVDRTEWTGCKARNPDLDAYQDIFMSIRDRYFVVSIADIVPNVEWIVSHPIQADVEFHHGELPFEGLAALIRASALTFCSPGFAAILSQAVGTPVVCTFGGYETTGSFAGGAKFSPSLFLGPHPGCGCFQHGHPCNKAFNVPDAIQQLQRFAACPSAKSSPPT